jgi:hypothetical protein
MLILGERLRTGSHQPLEGPAIYYEMIRLRPLSRSQLCRPSQGLRRNYMAILPRNHHCLYACRRNRLYHHADLLIHPFLRFNQHGTRIGSH